MAVMPFVVEYTLAMVSRSHGCVRAASACPAQRSTTGRPSSSSATAAPVSPKVSKFDTKVSRTRAKRGSQVPLTFRLAGIRSSSGKGSRDRGIKGSRDRGIEGEAFLGFALFKPRSLDPSVPGSLSYGVDQRPGHDDRVEHTELLLKL